MVKRLDELDFELRKSREELVELDKENQILIDEILFLQQKKIMQKVLISQQNFNKIQGSQKDDKSKEAEINESKVVFLEKLKIMREKRYGELSRVSNNKNYNKPTNIDIPEKYAILLNFLEKNPSFLAMIWETPHPQRPNSITCLHNTIYLS